MLLLEPGLVEEVLQRQLSGLKTLTIGVHTVRFWQTEDSADVVQETTKLASVVVGRVDFGLVVFFFAKALLPNFARILAVDQDPLVLGRDVDDVGASDVVVRPAQRMQSNHGATDVLDQLFRLVFRFWLFAYADGCEVELQPAVSLEK